MIALLNAKSRKVTLIEGDGWNFIFAIMMAPNICG